MHCQYHDELKQSALANNPKDLNRNLSSRNEKDKIQKPCRNQQGITEAKVNKSSSN